ncbi:MAG: hypothetical protein FWC16_02065 [Defluviitaleaceae bacterium]|nr:hypothetical protein [Defluviitaleaceae bacterium]MCL2273685.1 hypothetical protein [Defluviitaleaceae bacterium]
MMKKTKRRKITYIVLSIFIVIVMLYGALIFWINNLRTYLVDLSLLSEGTAPLIAYNTPPRRGTNPPPESDIIMEFGKNPGLGVRALHERGITGSGVGVAIIDQDLLVSHGQFAGRVRLYEILNQVGDSYASLHGTLAAYAVSRDIGVAPEANLFYISTTAGFFAPPFIFYNVAHYAQSIDRIIEINQHLPEEERVRVIGIMLGQNPNHRGAQELYDAVERAREANIFVIFPTWSENDRFSLGGLGRDPLADPDDLHSFTTPVFWGDAFFETYDTHPPRPRQILVPVDSRVRPSHNSNTEYVFDRRGGNSGAVPWLAGMYALCVQVYPNITPELFLSLVFETGDTLYLERNGRTYSLSTVINPARLIEALEARALPDV